MKNASSCHDCSPCQVYRGSWNGTTVAVKVIETSEPLEAFDLGDGGLAPGGLPCVRSFLTRHPEVVREGCWRRGLGCSGLAPGEAPPVGACSASMQPARGLEGWAARHLRCCAGPRARARACRFPGVQVRHPRGAAAVQPASLPAALPCAAPPAGKSGIFEAVLSSNLSHPNIVHTYQYAFRPSTVRRPRRRTAACQLG